MEEKNMKKKILAVLLATGVAAPGVKHYCQMFSRFVHNRNIVLSGKRFCHFSLPALTQADCYLIIHLHISRKI